MLLVYIELKVYQNCFWIGKKFYKFLIYFLLALKFLTKMKLGNLVLMGKNCNI